MDSQQIDLLRTFIYLLFIIISGQIILHILKITANDKSWLWHKYYAENMTLKVKISKSEENTWPLYSTKASQQLWSFKYFKMLTRNCTSWIICKINSKIFLNIGENYMLVIVKLFTNIINIFYFVSIFFSGILHLKLNRSFSNSLLFTSILSTVRSNMEISTKYK